jgi:hypothetical protein
MAVQIRQNGKWVNANTGFKLDSTLSKIGEAAEAAAVGTAIANLKNNTKVIAIDFSKWDENKFFVHLADETLLEFSVAFKDGIPVSITDSEDTTTVIYWE